MKCMLCGIENRDEAMRCKGCGAQLSSTPRGPIGRTPAPTVLESSSDPRQPAGMASPLGSAGAPASHLEPPPTRRTRIATAEELAGAPAGVPVGAGNVAPVASSGVGARSKTVYVSPDAQDAEPVSQGGRGVAAATSGAPRLFGFLVSYTWNPAGQWFALREGKNVVGSEPGLEGSIPADRALSGKHFSVMYRRGEVRIRDLDSTNATRVDGDEVWGDSVAVAHGSVIKAGDTTFQLVVVPSIPGAT